jgi:hypothetical protein
MSSDGEILAKVLHARDFLRSALLEDRLDDWNLARDLGEFLVRVDPEAAFSHLILAKAYRHLGDLKHATEELERCRTVLIAEELADIERRVLLPVLEEEERLLA